MSSRSASTSTPADVDVVMPVHQEGASIGDTVRSWLAAPGLDARRIRVVASEDGSTDDTVAVLEQLALDHEVTVLHHPERLGYSAAVVAGVAATTAPVVVCVDSDGQFDPGDLARLVADVRPGVVICGVRTPRRDPWIRRAMSASFRVAFEALHGIRRADPSGPFVAGTRADLRSVMVSPPTLAEGYWWEFHIRAAAAGLEVREVPVHHRPRASGTTQVYRPSRLAGIVARHLLGLWRLRSLDRT